MSMDKKYPLLGFHLRSGTIWRDGNTYVGRAENQPTEDRPAHEEVQLGQVGEEKAIESWLKTHIHPKSW